jgi:hypothetical protein
MTLVSRDDTQTGDPDNQSLGSLEKPFFRKIYKGIRTSNFNLESE